MSLLRSLLLLVIPILTFGQLPVPENGTPASKFSAYALRNATIVVSPEKTIEKGTILVRNGRIEKIGMLLSVPDEYVIVECEGKIILPAFIELNSSLGIPAAQGRAGVPRPQLNSEKPGPYYWNESIHPETDATALYSFDEKSIDELHKMGFGVVVSHQNDGIAQGTGSVFLLGKKNIEKQLWKPKAAAYYSFRKGVSHQSYPSSLVGSIALLRQAFYDAEYHVKYESETNYSLDALDKQKTLPSFFLTDAKYDPLRVSAIAREFKRSFIILGNGEEYQCGKIWDTFPYPMLVPINFPAPLDLKDPYIAHQVPLEELRNWEQAPGNLYELMQQKNQFALTSTGMKSGDEFWKNIHKALSRGWTVEDALRSLTTTPAKLLDIQSDFGSIEEGKVASFMVYDRNPFFYDAKLLEAWSNGERMVKIVPPEADIRGTYSMLIDGQKYWLDIKGAPGKLSGIIRYADTLGSSKRKDSVNITLTYSSNEISLNFVLKAPEAKMYSLKGIVTPRVGIFEGEGTNEKGQWVKWSAIKNKSPESSDKTDFAWKADSTQISSPHFPNSAWGYDSIPVTQTIVIQNVTIWTNEAEGIINNGTVVVEHGKIKAIHQGSGTYMIPNGAKVIDGTGKILTSGIIDEHSHIALTRGVNESGQSNTSEVRMADAIFPDDINIYRQLSGGVTAAQLLHGSANAVGGQSALVKLKYGHLPQEMLIPNAPKFVKFALGENVKQTNWGDDARVRFPQTRMGVEQVYMDGFTRALEYHRKMEAFDKSESKHKNKDHKVLPPARDLELDAMYEIVTGERRITCHSYIQSEINMLMHVADSFGFTVNTFTHILEGYKIADKMKEHGAGASTFADWWAYKFEVKDAIPYNASLMNEVGLVVAINSDDAEMGRRLNQEAAKVMKYGGIPEMDAWKLVTLNPAKLLHLDDRMGSVKVGKDADLVLWTTNPLSIEAKVVYTIVDGEILYDAMKDAEKAAAIEEERMKLIAKMLEAPSKGEAPKPFAKRKRGSYHCDTMGEETTDAENLH